MKKTKATHTGVLLAGYAHQRLRHHGAGADCARDGVEGGCRWGLDVTVRVDVALRDAQLGQGVRRGCPPTED